MKKLIIFILLIGNFGLVKTSSGQCVQFAENIGLALLNTDNYRHDGYLNSIQLAAGEHIDVVKPFFKGKKYRIVVVTDSKVYEYVNFKIINSNKIVVYNNKADEYSSIWEFSPQESQNYVISVQVPDPKPGFKKGCVAIITGVKRNEDD